MLYLCYIHYLFYRDIIIYLQGLILGIVFGVIGVIGLGVGVGVAVSCTIKSKVKGKADTHKAYFYRH